MKTTMTNNKLDSRYIEKTYDEFLATYQDTYSFYRWFRTPVSRFHYEQSRRALLLVLKKHYEKGLEVGGGDGVWTEFILQHVQSLDFLDISKEMIKRAQERFKNNNRLTFIQDDFLKNTLGGEQYDLLVSFRNFEYFEDKEKGMSEFSRVLRHNGELIIVTKSPEYDWKGYFNNKAFHSGQISINHLCSLLDKNGFKVIKVLPAIIGKKIGWSLLRPVYHFMQYLLLKLPRSLVPTFLLKYVSESFLVYAVKRK